MTLLSLGDISVWRELEEAVFERWALAASVFDTHGIRVTGPSNAQNVLCKKIKATSKGQAFICATAQLNMAAMAQKTRKPVLEECDAGMGKLVVPIFYKDEFVGTAGGCGSLLADGEVDGFAVNRLTELDDALVEDLSQQVQPLTESQWQAVTDFIQDRLGQILAG